MALIFGLTACHYIDNIRGTICTTIYGSHQWSKNCLTNIINERNVIQIGKTVEFTKILQIRFDESRATLFGPAPIDIFDAMNKISHTDLANFMKCFHKIIMYINRDDISFHDDEIEIYFGNECTIPVLVSAPILLGKQKQNTTELIKYSRTRYQTYYRRHVAIISAILIEW